MALALLGTRLSAALALAAALGCAHARAAEPTIGVFEDDDRADVSIVNWPWIAIGRIERSDGALCTGALIARDRILTAAHCLYDRRGGGYVEPRSLRFDAGYLEGRHRASARGRSYLRVPEPERANSGAGEDLHHDWAIVELEKELWDGGWLRPIPIADMASVERAVAAGAFVAQAGYSGDRPEILSRNDECRAARLLAGGALMLHRCDATFGDSGSPILTETPDGFALLGLHVAVLRFEGRAFGAAVVPPREALRGE